MFRSNEELNTLLHNQFNKKFLFIHSENKKQKKRERDLPKNWHPT